SQRDSPVVGRRPLAEHVQIHPMKDDESPASAHDRITSRASAKSLPDTSTPHVGAPSAAKHTKRVRPPTTFLSREAALVIASTGGSAIATGRPRESRSALTLC